MSIHQKNTQLTFSPTLQTIIPEILESILVFLPNPYIVSSVCRQFHTIVINSPSFKRRWLRRWLHSKLPDAFLPTYSELCKAVETKTPFNILMQIIDLQKLCNKPLASSSDGSVTKLVDVVILHNESDQLIPFLISRGLNMKKYVEYHTSKDIQRTKEGINVDNRLRKDYLSPLIIAAKKSMIFSEQLAFTKDFFTSTELAFAIVLHERLDVASSVAFNQQHILDILDESVDRQYTAGIGWAFQQGVGTVQKNNPLYLRLCIEKADVESAKILINSGAAINISPSNRADDPSIYGATSLLEFSIQCYFQNYIGEEANREARKKMIRLFLDSGADPNSDDGRPLALCVTNHDWELTRLLIQSGADVNRSNKWAVRIATDCGYKDMAKVLYRKARHSHSDEFTTGTTSNASNASNVVKGMVRKVSMLGKSVAFRRKSEGEVNHSHRRNDSSD
ncbi:26190_t:CDS:1 [Dentiscutata erythropus]|uniref:26190_t:CDS:1 n=1 Tax=Dentiscutata erythropus TaxID=1348616 RepID=A0A9N9EJU5_9GLOM|nr:26190_t:CDS:1 [Dentiscutata erythropus]